MKKPRLLISLLVILLACSFGLASVATAKPENFTVKVYPLEGQPFIVKNFLQFNKYNYWRTEWRGSQVNLQFKDIRLMEFINPGKRPVMVKITFRDGRTDEFKITMDGFVTGSSPFGSWSMELSKIAKLDFSADGKMPAAGPGMMDDSKFDRVGLKNGDTVSGDIKTEKITLRTSYGTLSFAKDKISSLEFEGGGQNIDVVVLKTGDRFSGVVQEPSISMKIRSGADINLAKDKLKSILFRAKK